MHAYVFSSCADRYLLIQSAIDEVKAEYDMQSTATPTAAPEILSEAAWEGEARDFFESAVRRAERKIIDNDRNSAHATDATTNAEELAKELMHTPGSLLNEEETAIVYAASGCRRVIRAPRKCDSTSAKVNRYRSAGGTCNNIRNPLLGAAKTPLRRLLPPQYEDGISQLRGTLQSKGRSLFHGPFSPPVPSARLVSLSVVRDRPILERNISHMLMQWGQFVAHDVGLAPLANGYRRCRACSTAAGRCAPIAVPEADPAFSRRGCLPFSRTASACDRPPARRLKPREQINGVTSYLDGSQLYGSRKRIQKKLRMPNSGRLRTGTNFPGITYLKETILHFQ